MAFSAVVLKLLESTKTQKCMPSYLVTSTSSQFQCQDSPWISEAPFLDFRYGLQVSVSTKQKGYLVDVTCFCFLVHSSKGYKTCKQNFGLRSNGVSAIREVQEVCLKGTKCHEDMLLMVGAIFALEGQVGFRYVELERKASLLNMSTCLGLGLRQHKQAQSTVKSLVRVSGMR